MAYYIYGKNTVLERLSNNTDIEEIYVQEGLKDRRILDALKDKEYKIVSKKKLDTLSNSIYHQGLVAKVKTYDYVSLDEVLKIAETKKYPTIVMLDGIEDVHNIGAIMRTMDALDMYAMIVPTHNSAPLTSAVAKVSTGAIEYVKVANVTNLTNTINKLKEKGYWIVGAEASGTIGYDEVDYKTKICLIVGSESKGISRLVLKQCDYVVSIPLLGHVNSLNVSNATAVMLYQILRNRTK